MLWLSTWMLDGWMHQRWFQKAFGGVLCIFTNFVSVSGVPRFWEVTVGRCHWSTWCDDPRSSVFCKPVINISGGCFPAYSIVSLLFSLRFISVSCLHHVWATKNLPLSLNGVPDHILQFCCRRQMEDFNTVCRSKLCFCRLPNFPVAWSTLLKGLVFKKEPSNLLSYYVHFQIQHASCFKNLVWPSRETCTSNPSWLRKFNQIEGHDKSWKGRQLKYWWLHISIQSGSRYIKLLPFLFLFLQGWHPKIFILSALARVLQSHVWMSAMQPGVEAGEGNQWILYAEAILLPFCLCIVGESSAPNECSYLPMANIQIDLRNSRMTNLNKRPDAKYQEGVFELKCRSENSATGNRVEQGAVSNALCVSYWMNILEARWKLNNLPTPVHLPWISKAAWRWKKSWEVKHSVLKLRRNVWAISWSVTSGKLYLNLTRVEVSTARYTTELYNFFL